MSTGRARSANRVAARHMLRSNVGRRPAEPSTALATTVQLAQPSRCQVEGQPPPHTFFMAESFAMTSSSAACHSASAATPLVALAVAVRYAAARARAASRCCASRAGSAAALSSMTAALVVAVRANALSFPFVSTCTAWAASLYVSHSCCCAAAVSAWVYAGGVVAVVVDECGSIGRVNPRISAATATAAVTATAIASHGRERDAGCGRYGGGGQFPVGGWATGPSP